MDREVWWATGPRGHKKSDTVECLSPAHRGIETFRVELDSGITSLEYPAICRLVAGDPGGR